MNEPVAIALLFISTLVIIWILHSLGRAIREAHDRSLRHVQQIEALSTFAIGLIRELHNADSFIEGDSIPRMMDRVRRLSAIVGVDYEALEKQVLEVGV